MPVAILGGIVRIIHGPKHFTTLIHCPMASGRAKLDGKVSTLTPYDLSNL